MADADNVSDLNGRFPVDSFVIDERAIRTVILDHDLRSLSANRAIMMSDTIVVLTNIYSTLVRWYAYPYE